MLAAMNGHDDCVALLLAAGADTEAEDAEGRTALHQPVLCGGDGAGGGNEGEAAAAVRGLLVAAAPGDTRRKAWLEAQLVRQADF